MPLVFAQNEVSLSDISYADVLGKSYEYPSRYRNLIQPGERFIYYRGGRRAAGSRETPVYFGAGTVGTVTDVGERFRCTIKNYKPFKSPVPFKDADGRYREPEANNRKAVGFYYEPGVREIDEDAYRAIVEASTVE